MPFPVIITSLLSALKSLPFGQIVINFNRQVLFYGHAQGTAYLCIIPDGCFFSLALLMYIKNYNTT